MKKLKKFVLMPSATYLTDMEQKSIIGGQARSGECGGKPQDQCGGKCDIDGHEGSCGWVYADYNQCMCAVVYVG